MRAFSKTQHGTGRHEGTFIRSLMDTNNKETFGPMLSEMISFNLTPESPFSRLRVILGLINSKEQAIAFIQACQSLPEPLKTLHLRSLARGFTLGKSPKEPIQDAFRECGLDIDQYPQLTWKAFSQAFEILRFFDHIPTIATEEQLREILIACQGREEGYRAIAAGIQVSETITLKTGLNEEMKKAAYASMGLNFEFFNHPVSIDDFLAVIELKNLLKVVG